MRNVNVRDTLRRSGVVGLLEAVGCISDGARPLAEECQADFGAFWDQVPNAGFMLQLAMAMGVDSDLVVQTARELVARLIGELGDCEAEASDCMDLCEAAFVEQKRASENLQLAVVHCAKYMAGRDGAKDAQMAEPWRPAVVATTMMLAQATMLQVCPCGQLHTQDINDSLFNMVGGAGAARMAHGMKTGRVPHGQNVRAISNWAAGIMADQLRELMPVEILLAQKMQTFPGVTEKGELVFNTRPVRGQA